MLFCLGVLGPLYLKEINFFFSPCSREWRITWKIFSLKMLLIVLQHASSTSGDPQNLPCPQLLNFQFLKNLYHSHGSWDIPMWLSFPAAVEHFSLLFLKPFNYFKCLPQLFSHTWRSNSIYWFKMLSYIYLGLFFFP